MNDWYSRPVFFVADVKRAQTFYMEKLGFDEDWAYEEAGETLAAQVSRYGLELILNKHAEKVGSGRLFISLHDEQVEPLRQELADKTIPVSDDNWGMPVSIVVDADGNQLFFSPTVSS